MLFGCGQQEQTEATVSDVSTIEKQNIENSESTSTATTDNGDKPTKVTDSETTYNTPSAENTTGTDREDQTTTESKTKENVETTSNAITSENKNEDIFTVTFKDYNGNTLKEEKVKKGKDATAPEPPKRDGYIFVKWDTYFKEVKTDITVNAVYKEITAPTLIVDTVKTNDKEAVVKVSAINNPGLLALLLKINYDESALTLKKVENGSTMTEYTFTGPKNLKSGCNASWNIIEVPENVVDGEVVLLHFEVNKDALIGSHNISVTCFDGAFNSDYESVDFDIINGSIII